MIVVVSGLPRSGTSLVMQMLAAGGLPVLTDHLRAADEDNPRGYFEWEPAKRLPQQPGLIGQAEGKAVKIVSSLLWALPPERDYRVLFLRRPLAEVAASQAAMIRRRAARPSLEGPALIAALDAHQRQVLALLAERRLTHCIVSYHDLLAAPGREAARIAEFLGLGLDCEAMARQVDPSLHRQRAPQP